MFREFFSLKKVIVQSFFRSFYLFQEGPASALLRQLLVPGAEPDQTREPGPRHAERHLHQQCHPPSGSDRRRRHTTVQEGQSDVLNSYDIFPIFVGVSKTLHE